MSVQIFLVKVAILQVVFTTVAALLDGITTQPSSPSMESQIIQILNQESLLRLELEKKIHALETKVESLESTTIDDKKVIANLTQALANASSEITQLKYQLRNNENEIKAVESHSNKSLLNLSNLFSSSSFNIYQRIEGLKQQLPIFAKREPAVVFLVHLSQYTIPAHVGPVVFDVAIQNIGGSYSTDSGVFTSPVTGVYSFSISISGGNADTHGSFKLNGQDVGYVYADNVSPPLFPRGSLSIALHCNKGDKLWFEWIDAGKQTIHGTRYSWFSGHLVHMDQ